MLYIAVVATPKFTNVSAVIEMLDESVFSSLGDEVRIITGARRGAERATQQWAKDSRTALLVKSPDWDNVGMAAGVRCNTQIVNLLLAKVASGHRATFLAFDCLDGEGKGDPGVTPFVRLAEGAGLHGLWFENAEFEAIADEAAAAVTAEFAVEKDDEPEAKASK